MHALLGLQAYPPFIYAKLGQDSQNVSATTRIFSLKKDACLPHICRFDDLDRTLTDTDSVRWPGIDYYNPHFGKPPSVEDPMADYLDREKIPRMPWCATARLFSCTAFLYLCRSVFVSLLSLCMYTFTDIHTHTRISLLYVMCVCVYV